MMVDDNEIAHSECNSQLSEINAVDVEGHGYFRHSVVLENKSSLS